MGKDPSVGFLLGRSFHGEAWRREGSRELKCSEALQGITRQIMDNVMLPKRTEAYLGRYIPNNFWQIDTSQVMN